MDYRSFSTVSLFPRAFKRLQRATTVQDREAALHDMDSVSGLFYDYLAKSDQGDPEFVQSCKQLYNDLGRITKPFEHADGTAGTYDVPAHHADKLPLIVQALSSYLDQEAAVTQQNEGYVFDQDDADDNFGVVEDDDDWGLFASEIKALELRIADYQEEAESFGEPFGQLWVVLASNDSDTFRAAVTRQLADASASRTTTHQSNGGYMNI